MTAPLHLRSLSESDHSSVLHIFDAVFPSKYRREFDDAWRNRDLTRSVGLFTSDASHTLHGFIVTTTSNPGVHQIEFLGIHPQVQAGGLGTRLLRSVLEGAQRVSLVPVKDPRVIAWYRRHGFRDEGEPVISAYTGDLEQTMVWLSPAPKNVKRVAPNSTRLNDDRLPLYSRCNGGSHDVATHRTLGIAHIL